MIVGMAVLTTVASIAVRNVARSKATRIRERFCSGAVLSMGALSLPVLPT